MEKFIQGSVWWFKRIGTTSCITQGTHPCVVLSATNWNATSGSVVIVPATTDTCSGTLKCPTLKLSESEGYFFPTQITTVPKKWLFTFEGVMDPSDFKALQDSIAALLLSPEANMSLFNFREYKGRQDDEYEPSISLETSESADEPLRTTTHKRREWTADLKIEFLHDCGVMPEDEVAHKWDLGSKYVVRKYRKMFTAQDTGDIYNDRGRKES